MKKLLIVGSFFLFAVSISAQDVTPKAGQIGILASFATTSASVGMNIMILDSFALRPEVQFNVSSIKPGAGSPTLDSQTEFGIGFAVAGLYELPAAQNFSLGIGGALNLGFNSRNITYNSTNPAGKGTDDLLTTTFQIAAVVDLQYSFSRNFAVFADTGLSFSTSTPKSKSVFATTVESTGDTTNTFGLYRTSLGVIFYFDPIKPAPPAASPPASGATTQAAPAAAPKKR